MNSVVSGPVYGLWHGGPGYSNADPKSDVERFDSVDAARNALSDRYTCGHTWKQDFDFVNRDRESVFTPAVSEEAEIVLYASLPEDENGVDFTDVYPDFIVKLTVAENGDIDTEVSPA